MTKNNLVRMHKEIEKKSAPKSTINIRVGDDLEHVTMLFSFDPDKDPTEVKMHKTGAMALAKQLVEACAYCEAQRQVKECATT